MNKEINCKRALISSIVSICLCVSMLVGTTFAWFTDTTSSENNVIKAGRLAADLEHKVGDDWISLKKNADHKVFSDTNWVPGYVLTESLKVVNTGNLALNYRLAVESDNTQQTYGPYGESLADVLDVYIAYGVYSASKSSEVTSNASWVRLGTLTELLAQHHVASGMLLPEGTVPEGTLASGSAVGELTITLALCMQKTAPDTYQGLKIGNLFFDLYATQASYESDSFDNTYDKSPYSPLIYDDGKEYRLNTTAILSADNRGSDLVTVLNTGTKVTVAGGYYDAADCGHALIIKDGATVEITGGAFTFDGNNGCCSDLIHIENGSTLNIIGGTFSADSANATLIYADKTSTIVISGGSFVDWNPADQNGVNYLAAGTALQTVVSGGKTTYIVKPLDQVLIQSGNNTFDVTGNSELMDVPLQWNHTATEAYTVNGNGHTVTVNTFPDNPFDWDETQTIPKMATIFSTANGELVTVNDITFTGAGRHITAGHYYSASTGLQGVHNTVFNNVNIINYQAYYCLSGFTNACGVYGTLEMNNCTMKGTTPHPNLPADYPVYDIAITNNSHVYMNDCDIGRIYTWEHMYLEINNSTVDYLCAKALSNRSIANIVINEGTVINTLYVSAYQSTSYPTILTIRSGAKIEVLDLSTVVSAKRTTVEEGAIIGKVIGKGGVEYDTYEEWLADFKGPK